MRWSQTFIPTMKEDPADAEIPSHKLMLRAGLIRQLMAGAYTYLPLGYRALRKAENIVRQEMDNAGAVELFMPALQPIELFERTGRINSFGNVLIKFEVTRRGNKVPMALGPTHEEVVTDLIARHISSYRQLPLTVYQIQTKFRNEERPRFGVLRTSEFLMKDAYSFSTSVEQLDDAYRKMYDAYVRIFARCGLEAIPVEAESGPIGGDASHEFMIPASAGEDSILRCRDCGYGANVERAETGRKRAKAAPPAADAKGIAEIATPGAGSIDAVCKALKCKPHKMIKTLIYKADDKTVAVLIRGDHDANENKIRRALGAKTVELADEATILAVTGAPTGFAGPVGIKCDIIADHDIPLLQAAITGANKVDAHFVNVCLGRDYQLPVTAEGDYETFDLRNAAADDPCPRSAGKLELVHGIEVGHVFKLGTKYTVALDATFLDEKEQRHPIIMGCYGIGVNRIIAGLAETKHDENGLIWPMSVAPYEVLVVPLNVTDPQVMEAAEKIYTQLKGQGVDVLMDDRDARPGFKLKDADLIGIPLRVVIGGKGLKDGVAEIKWRTAADPVLIKLDMTVNEVTQMVKTARQ
ncbi:proline--tRNA ligase [Planctomicrobium piriforme]|uniref:Proline--tRNA ligase n=1 Tax=Planctomicrobium piriforme TaxID=1576369 RepID=A0A1I3PRQ0_9PLAN|nr:proline--tRNA ligase [Planctomicrobium piriforme]SFJ24173.1 prolyl-tRNA synthetase [Planctomicrobium piriforme]